MELTAIINKINFVFVGRFAFDTFAWGRNISEHKAWISTDTHFKNNEENGFYAV